MSEKKVLFEVDAGEDIKDVLVEEDRVEGEYVVRGLVVITTKRVIRLEDKE